MPDGARYTPPHKRRLERLAPMRPDKGASHGEFDATSRGAVALVTGAGPGLGRALARSLAEAGANIVVCDINEAGLAAARAAVEEAGSECLTVRCDVSDSAAVQRMFAEAAATLRHRAYPGEQRSADA